MLYCFYGIYTCGAFVGRGHMTFEERLIEASAVEAKARHNRGYRWREDSEV
jgi:hypothetical protein